VKPNAIQGITSAINPKFHSKLFITYILTVNYNYIHVIVTHWDWGIYTI